MRWATILFLRNALGDLAEPSTVVLPGPAGRYPTAGHRAYRSLDPEGGVDVDDDRANEHERTEGVQQRGEADQVDGKEYRKIAAPDHDAGKQQTDQAEHDDEEQQLLPRVVTPHLGEVLLAIFHHIANFPDPDPVARLHGVVAMHGRPEKDECGNHEYPDERVQDSRPGSAAEQVRQPKERRVKQRKSRQCEQNEADRNDPVVDARGCGVADNGITLA